ncbi:MAG: ABC transporter permease [Firmicutes bacterium]|nr:ABC transporter permease [Bacillota bacterium]
MMARTLAARLAWTAFELVAVATVTFVLAYLLPGDPARTIAGPHASPATIAAVRRQLGLNLPLWVQFGRYLWRLAHLNLGTSIEYGTPVLADIWARFPATAELALAGIVFEVAIGVPFGVFAAMHRGRWFDRVSTAVEFMGISVPPFWLGIVLIFLVAFKLRWLPIGGDGSPVFPYLVLPGLTLGLGGAAYYAQVLRARVLEVLSQPFVRVAQAKGLTMGQVVLRHVLPNVTTTLVTQIGMDLGYFMAGVVVVEAVFGWPGIGMQAWTAIQALDEPLILGTTLFGAFWIIVANLVVDIAYQFLDPRARSG